VPGAQELIPLRGALVPVPAQPQDGVCSICHSSAKTGFTRCLRCSEAAAFDPPEILPIALSVHGELIHSHLRNYKDSPSADVRSRMSFRLAALLATFMSHHARCVGEWDYATCVPLADADRAPAGGRPRRALRLSLPQGPRVTARDR
jgi:hypothetical protein